MDTTDEPNDGERLTVLLAILVIGLYSKLGKETGYQPCISYQASAYSTLEHLEKRLESY